MPPWAGMPSPAPFDAAGASSSSSSGSGSSGGDGHPRQTVMMMTPEEEQQQQQQHSVSAPLQEGDPCFLVAIKWVRDWNGGRQLPQGTKIRNESLLEEEELEKAQAGRPVRLRSSAQKEVDFSVVSEETWRAMQKYYGGGPEIARKVVMNKGLDKLEFGIETVFTCYPSNVRDVYTIPVVLPGGVDRLKSQLAQRMGEPAENIELFDFTSKSKGAQLKDSQALQDCVTGLGLEIWVECKPGVRMNGAAASAAHMSEDLDSAEKQQQPPPLPLPPPPPPPPLPPSFQGASTMNGVEPPSTATDQQDDVDDDVIVADADDEDAAMPPASLPAHHPPTPLPNAGLSGLSNLGNTCFMNSALQCLMHTPDVQEYFTNEQYTREINRQNPLGTGGQVAEDFGNLMAEMWLKGKSIITPRAFKSNLAKFAPQFTGYSQQDSQELLAFVLDALHEDLNRRPRKPYAEVKYSDGRPDKEVAQEAWNYHKERNDSVIVDHFQGQYKSKLVCPNDQHVSVTFDPYMYLSVPVPDKMLKFAVIDTAGERDMECHIITKEKGATDHEVMKELKDKAKLTPHEKLELAKVDGGKLIMLDRPQDAEKLVAFRIPQAPDSTQSLDYRNKTLVSVYFKSSAAQYPYLQAPIGVPLLMPVERGDTAMKLKAQVVNVVRTMVDAEHLKLFEDSVANAEYEVNQKKIREGDEVLGDERFFTRGSVTFSLIVPKEHEEGVKKMSYVLQPLSHHEVSLQDCLFQFSKAEPLSENDMWYCPKCKQHVQATKKIDLWKIPNVLVVHLKRFSYNRYWRDKLDTFVRFPLEDFDVRDFYKGDSRDTNYELFAISNHFGGLGGGHYTAFAKRSSDRSWYQFDDSSVRKCSEQDIVSAAAYLLFYRLKRSPASTTTATTTAT